MKTQGTGRGANTGGNGRRGGGAARTRLVIVDDSRRFRHQLALLLQSEPNLEIVGLAGDGVEAVELVNRLRPDVVLMDQSMPRKTGVQATVDIRRGPSAPCIIFIAADPAAREKALKAGADGFFLKEEPLENVVAALRKVRRHRPEGASPGRARETTGQAPLASAFVPLVLALLLVSLVAGIALFPTTFLPGLGLALGLFFFLYALKYYISVGIVLAASGGKGNGNGNGHNGNGHHGNGNGKSKRNGLRPYGNGNGRKAWTRRQPFISIHLPVYNEKEVVERLMRACTSLEYQNYEVVVADDSTDETAGILRLGWGSHPRVRISHRVNRKGFKGGALQEALAKTDPRAEFVVVLDADFIPPPDILQQFLAYFYGSNGNGNGNGEELRLLEPSVAAVQGYQWHVLNASENWITRGIRAEFSGSYVVERAGQQLGGAMKMIAGSVFMIRADVLRRHGWSTSITEDWDLTLRLYLDGWKVLYTPFVQAPAECVSSFKQLARQRMRWAEGHTFNVKKYFWRVVGSPRIRPAEKLEFAYFAPYYLQSAIFMVGTAAWLVSELLLHQHLPFWSATLGWSLVFANALSLVLMNLAGLFLERGVKRNWGGLFSFILLTYLLVPYQAYAALKGLLEPEEGGWHRTQKTGVITEVIDRLGLARRMRSLLPKKKRKPDIGRRLGLPAFGAMRKSLGRDSTATGRALGGFALGLLLAAALWLGLPETADPSPGLMAATASIPLLMAVLSAPRRLAWRVVSVLVAGLVTLGILGSQARPVVAGRDLVIGSTTPTFWLYDDTTPQQYMMYQSQPAGANTNSQSPTFYSDTFPESWSIQSGTTTIYVNGGNNTPNDTTFTVTLYAGTGSTWTQLGTTTLDILSFSPVTLQSLSFSTSSYTFTAGEQLRLTFSPDVAGARLYWDGTYNNSRIILPGLVVPENAIFLVAAVILLPVVASGIWRRKRVAARVLSGMLAVLVASSALASQVSQAIAAPDVFYLHDTNTSGITPAGRYMNTTIGTAGSTMAFNTVGQNAYWYADQTWPTGGDNGGIAAGNYTLDMYFSQLPRPWWNGNYAYRQQITVTAGSVNVPTNYSVRIQFNHSSLVSGGKSLASGDDIRIVYWNGSSWTELDRRLDDQSSWNSATTQVWFRTQAAINATQSDGNYYLYYGYSGATSPPTNWANTFLFYDDFNDGSFDAGRWGCTRGSCSESGGNLTLDADSSVWASGTYALGVDTRWEARVQLSASNVVYFNYWGASNADDYSGDYITFWADAGNHYVENGVAGTFTNATFTPATPTSFHVYTFDREGSANVRYFQDGTQVGNLTADVPTSNLRVFNWNDNSTQTQTYDWVRVRRYVNPEPTNSLGAEATSADVRIVVTVSHTAPDGSGATTIVTSSTTTINSSTSNPLALSIGSGAQQTFTSSDPRRLRVQISISAVNGGERFVLAYDGSCGTNQCSDLSTPLVTVPDNVLWLAVLAPPFVATVRRLRNPGRSVAGPKKDRS